MKGMLRLSEFGSRFTRQTGALELMDDLGRSLSGESEQLMLGGGNPGKIPAIQRRLAQRLTDIGVGNRAELERMLSNYAHPTGEVRFRRSLAKLLRSELGWDISEENIALTAGSQAAFFMLLNLFGGRREDGSRGRILFPVTPEYVGYADVGLEDEMFTARLPSIEHLSDAYFKYRLDFEALDLTADIAAVCISRPTNPTGNVLSDSEIAFLDAKCRASDVPLIIDGAYGSPFPGIVFVDATPIWNENIIYCMSLSKLGLPAARTGIVIARADIIDALTKLTAVMNLTVGSIGPVLVQPWLDSGEILTMSRANIMPFYRDKAERACDILCAELKGLSFRIHRPEGAFFLWLWFEGLPIPSAELYERLKAAGVFVLSGHHFFPGLAESWGHRHECLRVSYAQDDAVVEAGLRILAREVRSIIHA
jgi:valine--pyruvate aminotransferase